MTFCMGGISYTELKEMDLAEFVAAEQARSLWQTVWNTTPRNHDARTGGGTCG